MFLAIISLLPKSLIVIPPVIVLYGKNEKKSIKIEINSEKPLTFRLNRIIISEVKEVNNNVNVPERMRVTLKMARELNGLTQIEAAKKIGISTDTLGNYERGKSYPDIPILRKIEEVYGVPYDRIIFLPLDFGLTENSDKKTKDEPVKEVV